MGVNPEDFYKVILAAERSGIIDKVMEISGEALGKFLEQTEYDLGDIFNRVDEATADLIKVMDSVIGAIGPFVRFAANERLFRIVSRILDFKIIKRTIIYLFDRIMILMMEGRTTPSLLSRLKTTLHIKSAG